MEIFNHYVVAMLYGIAVAQIIKWSLRRFPFGINYKEEIKSGLIGALAFSYYLFWPLRFRVVTIEKDLESWKIAVSISWTICVLGLPMVLPRIWASVLVWFSDSTKQWFLTAMVAILSYIVFTTAQWFADVTIQSIMQTHPDQLPGAQRVLTAIGAIRGWIGMLYSLAVLTTFLTPMIIRSRGRRFLNMAGALLVAVFVLLVVLPNALVTYQKAMSTTEQGGRARGGSLWEDIILWSSFMPNQVVEGVLRSETGDAVQQTHLACRNLPPEVYVAFVNPDEVAPDKVVVAEPRNGEIAEGAPAYSYRVAACENSVNPNDIK